MDDALRDLSASQHGLISRKQALKAGLSLAAWRWLVECGQWQIEHPGVIRRDGVARTWEQAEMGGCLAVDGIASYRAAGVLHRLPNIPPRLEVTIPGNRRATLKGFEIHRTSTLERVDFTHRNGIPVTSLARTVVDLALDDLTLGRGLVTHVLARQKLPLSLLFGRLEVLGTNGRKGARPLMNMLEEMNGRKRHVDSDMQRRFEQIAIKAFKDGLLPEPHLEYAVLMPDGRWRYPDIAFPHVRIGFEYQSFIHHSTLEDFAKDQARNLELFGLGWFIVPITAVEVRAPVRLVELMARIIAAAEARARA